MSHGTDGQQENALGKAASAYLRSARYQPVAWQEWGEEAFAQARRENKPVLLDIGAVWCHWCHVMDRESYEDANTAALINENFVAVKVDRDERPDVDARYQAAVSSISGQGGWPLTAFLTPDGQPFFGGTYFPPDDRYGRPGFRRVLAMMADAFEDRAEEVQETAASVMAAIEHNETFSARGGDLDGDAGRALIAKLLRSAIAQFDARNGGFGSQPKFPHAAAMDLLIDAASRTREDAQLAEQAKVVVTTTLRKMAAGGIHDHLAGGFHRYSVDERWIVPHFEKMAYDNSELLKNYAHAFATFGEPEFGDVARGILRWMDEWLSDRALGGFYASQDADDSLEDDGDYFTWTRAEAAAALSEDEFAVAAAWFNLRPVGDMHHNAAKNVLHHETTLADIARAQGRSEEDVRALRNAVVQKMYAARLKRKTPYVDKTVYTGWNGMCISAYFAAAQALRSADVEAFALLSLDRVLDAAWSEADGLAHVVAYGEGVPSRARVAGVLEDYAFVATAALDAWEAAGEMKYFAAAQRIAASMIARFYDRNGGAFFDTEVVEGAIGALRTRRKPLQDAPTPSGNSVAAAVLLRLAALTDNAELEQLGRETLQTFAGVVEHFGLYAGSYGLALRRLSEGSLQVCVMGEGALAEEMAAVAAAQFAANKSVVRVREVNALPAALAETLPHVSDVGEGIALVCRGMSCLPPARNVAEIVAALGEG
jgi:uncharacterized protein YyaL (SSP411 family)